MARLWELSFYQHKVTGNWIAGIAPDGSYEYSPKMCDAMLFHRVQAGGVSTMEHKREYVIVKAFVPPRPPRWKPPKKAKATTKKPAAKKSKKTTNAKPDTVPAEAVTG